MPKNGVLGVAVALGVIGFGVTEASAACDGGPCRGYAYASPSVVYAPPPVYAYAPPQVYAYAPTPGAYGVIVGWLWLLPKLSILAENHSSHG
jgi:hypothetical protein